MERAKRLIGQGSSRIERRNQNDVRQYITRTSRTKDGTEASKVSYSLNEEAIESESRFDGFYAVCTNLETDIDEIIRTLRGMRVTAVGDTGYVPSYTRTSLTDALHELAGFRTDYEVIRRKQMQGNVRRSKGL